MDRKVLEVQVPASAAHNKLPRMMLLCTDDRLRAAARGALEWDDPEPVAVALLAGRRLLALAQLRGLEDGDLPGVSKLHLDNAWWFREASQAAVCAVLKKWNFS